MARVTSGTEKIKVEWYDSDILWQILSMQSVISPHDLPTAGTFLLQRDVQQAESERAAEWLLESPSERMTEHREKYILLLRALSREMKVRFFGVSVIGE